MRQALVVGSIVSALLLGSVAVPAQTPATQKKSPYVKLAEPWPPAERLRQLQTEVERRRLFAGEDPLQLTVTADFKTVTKDRDDNSTKRYPATIAVAGEGSTGAPLSVKLGTRGHTRLRRATCTFVPLRVEFPPDAAGTVFEGQKTLKLVTHCRDVDDYEQYVLREYLVYKVFNLLTPRSFRARLAKISYVDTSTGKPLTTRYGFFLEDDDDVARRTGGRTVSLPNALFKDLDQESLTLTMLFEYMIANTDVSIVRLHNIRLIQDPTRALYPVPYDFDYSGLVDTRYAIPAPKLELKTVRDRLYRGPCLSEAELEPILEKFRARKADIMKLYAAQPDLDKGYRRAGAEFLDEFYTIIERKDRARRALVDGCTKMPGM
jgi:hypothetical protein